MKKIIKLFNLCLLLFIVALSTLNIKQLDVIADSSSEICMEVNSNRILHQSNAYTKKYMASTTKILTAIVVIENCNMSDIITITNKTVGVEGSSIYLVEGEKLSVKDLLYGLMLRSGNDCAETLALYCSGSISEFAKLMNETACKIGATDSNFVNPHGLHDDNHYTTAYDLALISCYALKNKTFREIVSTKVINIPHTKRDYNRKLVNKNKMLTDFEGSTGIKTGFTKKAGRCLVSSCLRNGMEVVCVVLNCPPMFERSKTLLTNCFMDYKNYNILESDNIIDFLSTYNNKQCGIYVKNDIILPLTTYEKENIKVVYEYPKTLNLPIKKDSKIGFVKIYCENNLLFEEKIYTIVDVN